jgi:hypothetical protein
VTPAATTCAGGAFKGLSALHSIMPAGAGDKFGCARFDGSHDLDLPERFRVVVRAGWKLNPSIRLAFKVRPIYGSVNKGNT